MRLAGLNGPGKSKTLFPDFSLTDSGLQFKDFKESLCLHFVDKAFDIEMISRIYYKHFRTLYYVSVGSRKHVRE